MDLARQILLSIEEKSDDSEFSLTAKESEKQTLLDYQVALLSDAHLIQAAKITYHNGSIKWRIERLTWEGHEFLDAARNETRWNQAKKTIGEKGGSLTFDVLKAVLAQLARQAVGL